MNRPDNGRPDELKWLIYKVGKRDFVLSDNNNESYTNVEANGFIALTKWVSVPIGEVTEINPKIDESQIADNLLEDTGI